MSELLYYSSPYLKEVEVTVTEIRDNMVVFDKTIFYPECGGQPGDRGFFGSSRILDTRKDKDGTPLHVMDGEIPSVGTKGTLKLDWDHRYFYMKEHTAQHLLSALLFRNYGIGTVAVHQGEEILTIETDQKDISEETLLSLEEDAIREIIKSRRVYQEEWKREEAENLKMRRSIKVDDESVKIVFIDGLDAVACGGVHIGNTGEIEELCYRGKEQIRGHVRTIWSIGKIAREYRRANEKAVKDCGKLLSSDRDNLKAETERLLSESLELKREVRELKKRLLENEILNNCGENSIVFSTYCSIEDAPELLSKLAPTKKAFILEKEKNSFVFFGSKVDFENIKSGCKLKGGGREPLFRGTITDCDLERIRELLS